ncbi:MAG: AAA family ATPase [Anaerolineales bacterium]
MNLTSLHIQHFQSLYDVELMLKPLTIFIGPNASGKSNLFKALRFIYNAVAGDRLDWQAYDGQLNELRWYGLNELGNRPETLEFSFDFRPFSNKITQGTYSTTLRCGDFLQVDQEEVKVVLGGSDQELKRFFERTDESVRHYVGRRGRMLQSPKYSQVRSSRTLHLRDEGLGITNPIVKEIYEHIAGWRIVDIDLSKARQGTFVPEYPEEVPSLAGDASNLSAFLYSLYRTRPNDLEAINDAIAEFIELPQSLLVEHDAERGGQTARYQFIEKPFGESHLIPPTNMSDGTIRLLTLLALLLGDRTVTLACLEEPDHGLHPRLMYYLADVLRQTIVEVESEEINEHPLQFIITTHSPEFMDCFDLEVEKDYLQVYIVQRDETGKTLFTPANAQEFAPWLQRFRLGEAVRRRLV